MIAIPFSRIRIILSRVIFSRPGTPISIPPSSLLSQEVIVGEHAASQSRPCFIGAVAEACAQGLVPGQPCLAAPGMAGGHAQVLPVGSTRRCALLARIRDDCEAVRRWACRWRHGEVRASGRRRRRDPCIPSADALFPALDDAGVGVGKKPDAHVSGTGSQRRRWRLQRRCARWKYWAVGGAVSAAAAPDSDVVCPLPFARYRDPLADDQIQLLISHSRYDSFDACFSCPCPPPSAACPSDPDSAAPCSISLPETSILSCAPSPPRCEARRTRCRARRARRLGRRRLRAPAGRGRWLRCGRHARVGVVQQERRLRVGRGRRPLLTVKSSGADVGSTSTAVRTRRASAVAGGATGEGNAGISTRGGIESQGEEPLKKNPRSRRTPSGGLGDR
ncbi:hypothetical protein K438DRAFT_1872343 [Mycena galopus ATCC 62051]|nr:hypothetical protein K438DRAFT_1872343 [Mycena galopus ATCC 62051]